MSETLAAISFGPADTGGNPVRKRQIHSEHRRRASAGVVARPRHRLPLPILWAGLLCTLAPTAALAAEVHNNPAHRMASGSR